MIKYQTIALRSGLTMSNSDGIDFHGLDDAGNPILLKLDYSALKKIKPLMEESMQEMAEQEKRMNQIHCSHPVVDEGICQECGAKESEFENLKWERYS